MNARELHNQIMSAVSQCPGYRPWAYTELIGLRHGAIKYKTLEQVVKYWLHDEVLWDKSYSDLLPVEAAELFNAVAKARKQAIATAISQLGYT